MEWYFVLLLVIGGVALLLALSIVFYSPFFKRVYDLFFSGLALLLLSPVFLVTSILIKTKLGSPVLYTSVRIGKNNKPFKLIKFRSMTNERGEDGTLLPDTERLTKFGRLLRSSSIDELPELINIFKGEMSFIGPRPLPELYLPYYSKEELDRHLVRPGLTGLAQVNGRNSISWDAKFRFDVEYVHKISFFRDVSIFFRTIRKVLIKEGIGQGEEHPGNLNEIRTRRE